MYELAIDPDDSGELIMRISHFTGWRTADVVSLSESRDARKYIARSVRPNFRPPSAPFRRGLTHDDAFYFHRDFGETADRRTGVSLVLRKSPDRL